jgi:flagellin-specific chaperone FliS
MSKEDMLNCLVPGYKLANSFCHDIYFKGGVCILARNDVIYQALQKSYPKNTAEMKIIPVTGIYPNRFKYAIVRPIHKKGDKLQMTNYRPISVLISCSKILETIMLNRLYQFVQVNNILAPEEFGFRKGSHIEKAIFTLTDNILTSLNQEKVGGIFCDLTEAFDYVNHDILLAKLCYYGIHGMNAKWFKTYITNRKQKVQITSQNHRGDFLGRWGNN